MKQLHIKLPGGAITNSPVFISTGDSVEFILDYPYDNKLYYSTGEKNIEIKDNKFTLSYTELKALDKLNIIVKNDLEAYPQIYPVVGLKIHDITVLGASLDEKYPEVIKGLHDEVKLLKKAIIDLYDRLEEKEKEGVIE